MHTTTVITTLLIFFCCGISGYKCDNRPEDSFDASTVEGDPWPWLREEAPAASKLCSDAVENRHFGRILACERLERLFVGVQYSNQGKADRNVELAINIMKEVTAHTFFLFKDEPTLQDELADILENFFKVEGGDYWRNGLVPAREQYSLTLWLFDKLDKMTSE